MKPMLLTGCLLLLSGCAGISSAPLTDAAYLPVSVHNHATGTSSRFQIPAGQVLQQSDAVQMALHQHPAIRALFADAESGAALRAKAAALPVPVFGFERVHAPELEIVRSLSLGLWELLLWPQRRQQEQALQSQARLQLTSELVQKIAAVRMAWVDAVAAQEQWRYAIQVEQAAAAASELAEAMKAKGNLNALKTLRHQQTAAEARLLRTQAELRALATREALLQAIGADAETRIQLPDRLPDLPQQAISTDQLQGNERPQRLDVRLAQERWQAARLQAGLSRVESIADIGLQARRGSSQGWEVDIALPLWDGGALQRKAAQASVEAARQQALAVTLQAASEQRVTYAAYLQSYDAARQHRDVLIPARRKISDEMLLRYNAMQISVFELLADAREQRMAVTAAIDALAAFWRADAALQSSLTGVPLQAVQTIRPLAGASAASEASH